MCSILLRDSKEGKQMIKPLVLSGACALLFAFPASAQRRAADYPPCAGNIATIRVSAVKPGKWAAFSRAVADHRAWYARHGGPASVSLARVIDRGRYSDGEAVTITVFRDPAKAPERDAAWNAFVAAYAATSTIKEERRVCLPKLA
jgi:hypothetical protein